MKMNEPSRLHEATYNALFGVLQRQRDAHFTDGPVPLSKRKDRLNRLIALTCENANAIADAISEDFGGVRSRHTTLATEVVGKVHGMEHARDHLEEWARSEHRESNSLARKAGATSVVMYQPKGVVGIISPWNMPFGLTVSPLTSALAAGNRAMVKPSELTPILGTLLRDLIAHYFAEEEIAVILGDQEVGKSFAQLPFDHLLFTGSTQVGRKIMEYAARNLVPVTLELGGKSPVVVGAGADLERVAQRLAFGKMINGGQLCLAPDYVLIGQQNEQALVDKLEKYVEKMFPRLSENSDVTGIVNNAHFDRLNSYLQDARIKGAKVTVIGGSHASGTSPGTRRMPLHVVQNVTAEMTLMHEEIFGPILPIVPYQAIADAVAFVRARPKPLALYYFGSDGEEERLVCEQTESGGFTANDLYQHYLQEDLPFGGVGASGMGAYHGRDGFVEMSHAKAIFRQAPDAGLSPALQPPFAPEIMKLYEAQLIAHRTAIGQ